MAGLPHDLVSANQVGDPRVGPGRNNSTGGTSRQTQPSELEALGRSLLPVLIFSTICLIIFFALRRNCTRVYASNTIPGIKSPECPVPPLPSGLFNWIPPFIQTPDSVALERGTFDGFFFLRYIKILGAISLVGCCLTWPVILPIHITGGNGFTQFSSMTISNVSDPKSFFAHVVISWLFLSFILFTICRECSYWATLRQVYVLSPQYSQLLSSRTVLFMSVPRSLLDEARLRKLFRDQVKNVWLPRNTAKLGLLVNEREQNAVKLENAIIDLIKMANAAREKATGTHTQMFRPSSSVVNVDSETRIGNETDEILEPTILDSDSTMVSTAQVPPLVSSTNPAQALSITARSNIGGGEGLYTHPYGLSSSIPDFEGSVAAQWISSKSRPSHRLVAQFGRSVDTIKSTRVRIKKLNAEIYKLRHQDHIIGPHLNAVFVEFDKITDAQAAYQIPTHYLPLYMSSRFIGVKPTEIIWSSLRMKWWELILRRFLITGFIFIAIIVWSFPTFLVGAVYESYAIVGNLPPAVQTGLKDLLPVIISLWMLIVPYMLRANARAFGVPTLPAVELFTQSAYVAFQAIQVFLGTTLTIASQGTITMVLSNTVLFAKYAAHNVPGASAYWFSYIIFQCVGVSAWSLLNFFSLFRHQITAKITDKPRSRFQAWYTPDQVHWGSMFPQLSVIGFIAITYSCIAPLMLGFTSFGMCCSYVVYKYNIIYVYDSSPDTQGLVYPRALLHLIFGIYMAEIFLIGFFVVQRAIAASVLITLFVVLTIIVHVSLYNAISPLLHSLPRMVSIDDEDMDGNVETVSTESDITGTRLAVDYPADVAGVERREEHALQDDTNATHLLEAGKTIFPTFMKKLGIWARLNPKQKPSLFIRWLFPTIPGNLHHLRRTLPSGPIPIEYTDEMSQYAYWPLEMWRPDPKLWIPRDQACVSRQEVAHNKEIISTTDEGAWLDRGRVYADLNRAPYTLPPMFHTQP